MRSDLKEMAAVRIQGTPKLKNQMKPGLVSVERMPQAIRALPEAANMWMKVPRGAYYGRRAAGCGFAWHTKMPSWEMGVTSSKTSAPSQPVWLSVPNPVLKGCSQCAPAAGRLSWLPGHGLLPGMLKQRRGEQLVTWVCTLVPPLSASRFPREERRKSCPFYSVRFLPGQS